MERGGGVTSAAENRTDPKLVTHCENIGNNMKFARPPNTKTKKKHMAKRRVVFFVLFFLFFYGRPILDEEQPLTLLLSFNVTKHGCTNELLSNT